MVDFTLTCKCRRLPSLYIVDSVSSPGVVSQASAQVTLSFGITWTEGAQVSATVMCPPNIVCGLTAAAQYLHVEGTQTMHYCGWDGLIDPNTYPCELSPNPLCNYPDVPAEVPYPYIAVLSLLTELFRDFVLTFS